MAEKAIKHPFHDLPGGFVIEHESIKEEHVGKSILVTIGCDLSGEEQSFSAVGIFKGKALVKCWIGEKADKVMTAGVINVDTMAVE